MRAQFITAEEVQQILNVSRSKSYQIIRELNKYGLTNYCRQMPDSVFQAEVLWSGSRR